MKLEIMGKIRTPEEIYPQINIFQAGGKVE